MNIFVCISITSQQTKRLSAALSDHQLLIHPDPNAGANARDDFENCEIAFGNPPADRLAASSNLKWVQLESVGFGEYIGLDWPTLGNRLRVTNLAGFFTEPVAESILLVVAIIPPNPSLAL